MVSVGIRGAGLAGLTFAKALLQAVPDASVTLFDRRPRLPHPGRTFCFFKNPRVERTPRPSCEWSSVSFAGPTFRRTIACPHSPYVLLRGNDFFEPLLQELETAGVSFTWGCDTVEVSSRTITVDGLTRRFDLVVDAAFDPTQNSATLWQSFAGIWVQSAQPVFKPDTALLMDLDVVHSQSSVRFMYFLPTSSTSALIEHTVFAAQPLSREEHLAACDEWISRQEYTGLQVLDTEEGRIPMGLVPLCDSDALPRIGTVGGAVRASTGYAFLSTCFQSEQLALRIAAALDQGTHLTSVRPPTPPQWMRFTDALFLRALARAPEYGQDLVGELLRRAPDQHLISFLSGTASLLESLRVMQCVPKCSMLRALLKRSEKESR